MKIEFEGESLQEYEALAEFFGEGAYITPPQGERRPLRCFRLLEELKESGGDTEDLNEELPAQMREEMIAAIDFIERMNVRIKEREFYLSCF